MPAAKTLVFRFADVEVREREFSLTKAGEVLPVEPKAFRVLLFLLRNPGKLIAKEELLNAVWGDAVVTDSSLVRSVALLRRLLGDETRNPRYIETVATVGYRFVCKVEVSEDATAWLDRPVEPEDATNLLTPNSSNVAKDSGEKLSRSSRRGLRWWLLSGAGILAAGMAALAWYLHRPLPPPHITEYVQITTDGRPKILAGTDGSRLYFTLMQSTNQSPHSLAEVAATGGEIALIPIAISGGRMMAVDVSRDGSSALIAAGEKGTLPFAFWSASLVGGSSKRLLLSAQGAAYSPDGRSIAYTTAEGELWMMGTDGSGAHKVGSVGAGGAYMPVWSPDGTVISFLRGTQIWEIASNGSNPHQLLPGWHEAEGQCCGHWTPDGRFFLFRSGKLWQDRGQLWALDERRGLLRQPPPEPIQLTSGPTRWGTPIASSDGKKIFAEGASPRGELSRYDAQSRQFQPFLKGISAEGVAFSRDGESVAYVSYPEGILWKANRDGSNPVQLTQPPMHPLKPRWSPDGKQILFMDAAPSVTDIYIVPAESGSPRRLQPAADMETSDPDWSPDGKKIVFETHVTGRLDEGGLRILDLTTGQVSTIPGSTGMLSPRWSPDGRKIAALQVDVSSTITSGLTIFDTESERWTTLLKMDHIQYPALSSDGQFLYYLLLENDQAVYRVRVKGGEPERVVDLKDWHMTGYFSYWMGLDPTDAPLLLRDNSTSDLYALTLEEK